MVSSMHLEVREFPRKMVLGSLHRVSVSTNQKLNEQHDFSLIDYIPVAAHTFQIQIKMLS